MGTDGRTDARTDGIEATEAKEILNEVISYESLLELFTRISFDSGHGGALGGGSRVGKGDEDDEGESGSVAARRHRAGQFARRCRRASLRVFEEVRLHYAANLLAI